MLARFKAIIARLPWVRAFELCEEHNSVHRDRLLHAIAVKCIQDKLTRRNKMYQHLKRKPAPGDAKVEPEGPGPSQNRRSTKYQRVAHL